MGCVIKKCLVLVCSICPPAVKVCLLEVYGKRDVWLATFPRTKVSIKSHRAGSEAFCISLFRILTQMEQYIKKILASRFHRVMEDKRLAPSAVLLLVVHHEKEYHVLLTKRSRTVAHHKGEVSFPGGTLDPDDDDLLCTALREGEEEIGVKPEDVSILGRLDDVSTTSTGFIIATYVGIIPYPYSFEINDDEIADLFIVPLKGLCRQYGQQCRKMPSEKSGGQICPSDSPFRHKGQVIWGATARILLQFLELFCDYSENRKSNVNDS